METMRIFLLHLPAKSQKNQWERGAKGGGRRRKRRRSERVMLEELGILVKEICHPKYPPPTSERDLYRKRERQRERRETRGCGNVDHGGEKGK